MQISFLQRFIFTLTISAIPCIVFATETTKTNAEPSSGLGRMVFGMLVVLAVMAGLAWFAKRVLPKQMLANDVIKQVGGIHLGPRERVVVLEISGRQIVVGISGGQMTALADIGPQFDFSEALEKHTT